MGRQPPALGADDNPPSPLPPPTPYTEPPTPQAMPDSPRPPPSRSPSPRLRPLRRLAAHRDMSQDKAVASASRADARTASNSASPAPSPSVAVGTVPHTVHQPPKAAASPRDANLQNQQKSETQALPERPHQHDSEPFATKSGLNTTSSQPAQPSVSDPSKPLQESPAVPPEDPNIVSLPSAGNETSALLFESVNAETPTADPMIVDTLAPKQFQRKEPSPHVQHQISKRTHQTDHRQRKTSQSESKLPSQPGLQLSAVTESLISKTTDKDNLVSELTHTESSVIEPTTSEQLDESRANEVIRDVKKESNLKHASEDEGNENSLSAHAVEPANKSQVQTQNDVYTATQGKSISDQPGPCLIKKQIISEKDTSKLQSMSNDVIDLEKNLSQPTQASSKPPRVRQLAVRTDFGKPERRQLALRIRQSEKPSAEPFETPILSSPGVSKIFKSSPKSDATKRLSSPDEYKVPQSRYDTRSAMKEKEVLLVRPRGRRHSEPVNTVISQRKKRGKPIERPVKGDRLRVLWHIDLLYYEGVVDSVLSYRGKQFYDVTYDSGEREYYLDLTTRKWRFANGRDGNDSDDSVSEPQALPDYSQFPNIDDKVLVMWHVDGKYYAGTVQDILKTSNGWFYDIGYEGGDREFFLDLQVRKWKYNWNETGTKERKSKPNVARSAATRPSREKIKRAARKSTGGSSHNYIPPTSMDGGGSSVGREESEIQPSLSLRKVESLLEQKERQEQERRAEEEQKRNEAEKLTIVQDLEQHLGSKNSKVVDRGREVTLKPTDNAQDSGDLIAFQPLSSIPSSELPRAPAKPKGEQPVVLDLPDIEDETFEKAMQDIDAPLASPSVRKRPRSPLLPFDTDGQLKRTKKFSTTGQPQTSAELESLGACNEVDLMGEAMKAITEFQQTTNQETIRPHVCTPPAPVPSSHHRGQACVSKKNSRLPPNAAPPARKSVQQRARSASRTQPSTQDVLQSEPDFIPRPRSVSRPRPRSRRPPSRRRTASPNRFMDRRKLISRDSFSKADYKMMRPTRFLSERAIEPRKNMKAVADIVAVSGLVAKRWIEENTKDFSVNLNHMDSELRKMKANHARYLNVEKSRLRRTSIQQSIKVHEPGMSDDEKDIVLGGVRNEFMGLVKRYRTVVEQREQALMQQFDIFRKTLRSQNSKLVATGKELEKLDIRGLHTLDNLQPVTRKKLSLPPPLVPRQVMNLTQVPRLGSSSTADQQEASRVQQQVTGLKERQLNHSDRSDAVAKSLRRKLADLVTRSDWLSEEVKRLQNRERFLIREKRDALAQLNKVRMEKGIPSRGPVQTSSRGPSTREAPLRASQKSSLKFAPSKPVGIVKKKSSAEPRGSGHNVGRAPRKSLPLGNQSYNPPPSTASNQARSEPKATIEKAVPPIPPEMTRSKPIERPTPMSEPRDSSRMYSSASPITTENVEMASKSTPISTEIDRGTTFTEDLGKSMDKQVSELLSLIFTIWLLQDEGRSEPPKQPGEKMDIWVRACVRNCLKHARTYLDATSGFTTARRSLMHDVDGENIFIEWILGDSEGSFEKARSNYSLWEPTLLDVEWLAEKRVLVGLSICYKKAWEETSARQYETTLMYAKAIAHKAVSNFELYMPHTIVLGPTPPLLPSAAKRAPQMPQPKSSNDILKDQPVTLLKASGPRPDVVVSAGNAHSSSAADPLTSDSYETARGTSSPPNSTRIPSRLSNTKSGESAVPESKVFSEVEKAAIGKSSSKTTQPLQPCSRAGVDAAVNAQATTGASCPTDSLANPADHKQYDNANPVPKVSALISTSESRTKRSRSSSGITYQGTENVAMKNISDSDTPARADENVAAKNRSDSDTPARADENVFHLQKVSERKGDEAKGGDHEGDASDRKIEVMTEAADFVGKSHLETQAKVDHQDSSKSGILIGTGTVKDTGGSLDCSEVASKKTTFQSKSAGSINQLDPQVSSHETQGKKKNSTDPKPEPQGSATNVSEPSPSDIGQTDGTQNLCRENDLHTVQRGHMNASSPKQTVVTRRPVSTIRTSIISRKTPFSSNQAVTHPPSCSTLETSTGSTVPANTSKAQKTTKIFLSMKDVVKKVPTASNHFQASNTTVSVGEQSFRDDLGSQQQHADPAHQESSKALTAPSLKDKELSATSTGASLASKPRHENAVDAVSNDRNMKSKVHNSKPSSPRAPRTETPLQSAVHVPTSTTQPENRGPRSTINKSSGTKGRKQSKSSRSKSTSGKGRASRASGGRSKEPTVGPGSVKQKELGKGADPSVSQPAGMIGLMRLPGASPTVPQGQSRTFPSSSAPVESAATRQPIGMKRLPQIPTSVGPQRMGLSGVDATEFESLPGPIPRRQGLKGVADDAFTHSIPHAMEQQGNPYADSGRWHLQQPVQKKGYKSLSSMPAMSQQATQTTGHSTNPFDARAVASPFEYNRSGDNDTSNEPRAAIGHESGYHAVEHVDMINPSTPAALSALDYSVEHVHREPLPSTAEFQERFDQGYDPYRSQMGHTVNASLRDTFGVGRNVHSKEYKQ